MARLIQARRLGQILYPLLNAPRNLWTWFEAYLGMGDVAARLATFAAPLVGFQLIRSGWRELPGIWAWIVGPAIVVLFEVLIRWKIRQPRLAGVHSSASPSTRTLVRRRRTKVVLRMLAASLGLICMLTVGLMNYIRTGRSKQIARIAVAQIEGLPGYEAEAWMYSAQRAGVELEDVEVELIRKSIQGNEALTDIAETLAHADILIRGFSWVEGTSQARTIEIRNHGGSLGRPHWRGNVGLSHPPKLFLVPAQERARGAETVSEMARCEIERVAGEEFLLRQNYEAALRILKQSLPKECPGEIFTRQMKLKLLARTYLEMERPELGVAYAREASMGSGEKDCAALQLRAALEDSAYLRRIGNEGVGNVRYKMEDFEERVRRCREGISQIADPIDRAFGLNEQGQLEHAGPERLRAARSAVELDGEHPQYLYNLAKVEQEAGNYEACAQRVEQSIQKGRWDARAYAQLATCQALAGRAWHGILNLLLAKALVSEDQPFIAYSGAEIYWGLSLAQPAATFGFLRVWLRDRSLDRLKTYLGWFPASIPNQLGYVRGLITNGRMEEAEKEAAKIAERSQWCAAAFYLQAIAQLQRGQVNAGFVNLNRALAIRNQLPLEKFLPESIGLQRLQSYTPSAEEIEREIAVTRLALKK